MLALRLARRLTSFIIIGVIILALATPAVRASDPVLLEGPGRARFADLGWTEDQVISAGSPAVVRFRLPDGTRQGEPHWYGFALRFEWTGALGAVGDYAFLNGRWNDAAIYQFKVKRVTDLDNGFQWSMVDAVNGTSQGYELSDTFRASSSNIAQISAVTGGLNEVGLSLGLQDAGNDDIMAVISKESEIIVTTWPPSLVEGHTDVKVRDNVVDLAVEGQNTGWAAPRLSATVLIWSDTHHDRFTWDLGPLEPLGTFELNEKIVLEPGRDPHRIDVDLDWGTGRRSYTVWDTSSVSTFERFIAHSVFRSTIGVMVAIVVLWVCVPMLVASCKQLRGK